VDHVELRRWLCDTAWWRRDGFGRHYERVPMAELRAEQQPLQAAMGRIDSVERWAAALRNEAAQAKAAKRAVWQAQMQSAVRPGSTASSPAA
jgi:hypothetical protein